MSLLLCLSLLLPPAPPALPEIPCSWVSADAQWVLHLDMQAAVASTLVSRLGELPWQTELPTELRGRLGLDLRTDVQTLTAYGEQDDPQTFVLLVQGGKALDGALEKLAALVPHERQEQGGMPIDRWQPEEGEDPFYSYLARRPDSEQRVLVLGLSAATVSSGLATLQGRSDHLSPEQARAALSLSPGAFLCVVVRDGLAALAEHGPDSQMTELVETLAVEAGEEAQQAFVRVSVGTRDASDAQKIGSVLQGATALLSLMAQSDEGARDLQPLLSGLSVKCEGARVMVRLQHDSAALADLMMEQVQSGHAAFELPPPAPAQDGWY